MTLQLTLKANRPLFGLVPNPALQTRDVELWQISVPFKEEVVRFAHIADIGIEFNRISIPVKLNPKSFWRVRWVEAGHPDTGIQGVSLGPRVVPVAVQPSLVIMHL